MLQCDNPWHFTPTLTNKEHSMKGRQVVTMPGKPEVVQLRRSGVWIVWGCPWPDRRWCGPYDTRKEAEGDYGLRGIKRSIYFERQNHGRKNYSS